MAADCYILDETTKDRVAGGACEANGFTQYFHEVEQELDPTRRADDVNGDKRYIIVKNTFDTNPAFASAVPYVADCPVLNSDHQDFPDVYEPPEGS